MVLLEQRLSSQIWWGKAYRTRMLPRQRDSTGGRQDRSVTLLIPVEAKDGWQELVRQAGTYVRCLYSASPLRQFAMVLGYSHTKREFRFLIFHCGGLISSLALDPNLHEGQQDILVFCCNPVVGNACRCWLSYVVQRR